MCLKIGSFLMQDGSNFMESRRDLEVVVRSGLTTDRYVSSLQIPIRAITLS